MTAILPSGDSYAAIRAAFRWNIPARCNLAEEVCDRWADGSRRLACGIYL